MFLQYLKRGKTDQINEHNNLLHGVRFYLFRWGECIIRGNIVETTESVSCLGSVILLSCKKSTKGQCEAKARMECYCWGVRLYLCTKDDYLSFIHAVAHAE